MIEISDRKARAQLAKLMDEVAENRETVVIRGRKREAVAMIAASELSSLAETAYLLRSPRNAERLLAALVRARPHARLPPWPCPPSRPHPAGKLLPCPTSPQRGSIER
jgi:antitoxin YefM